MEVIDGQHRLKAYSGKCLKGHNQPNDHDNNCNYCVAVYGYTINS